jgi:integrase
MRKNFKKILKKNIKQHNWKKSRGKGPVSFETYDKRKAMLIGGFTLLLVLGYKIKSPENFREYHMKILAHEWERLGIKDIQTWISAFRVYAGWIGKGGMIKESKRYVRDPESVKRSYVAKEDKKTWSGKSIDVKTKIREVGLLDPRVALILEIMFLFGLRIKEALLFRPHKADRGNYLDINRGTKGGRPRISDIDTPEKRAVIDRAKEIASRKSSSLIPDDKNYEPYRKKFYRICNKAGIGQRFGIVPHGLRHEYANQRYQQLTGQETPIKGVNKDGD